MKNKIFTNIIIVILVIIFIVSGYFVVTEIYEYRKAQNEYGDIQDIMNLNGELSKNLLKDNFNKLKGENEDYVGYIFIENTNISYPIMQSTNNAYYLDRTFEETYNASGSIFLDYQHDSNFNDTNTTLYGHNMKDGSMFHDIVDFRDKDFFEENRYIKIYLEEEIYTYEIFSVALYEATDSYYKGAYSDRELDSLLNLIENKSLHYKDLNLNEADKILTLSTCEYDFEDARLALHGKLVGIE